MLKSLILLYAVVTFESFPQKYHLDFITSPHQIAILATSLRNINKLLRFEYKYAISVYVLVRLSYTIKVIVNLDHAIGPGLC